ncbi:MAG: hypothetical protein NTW38_07055 [Candidatus Aminicenantes bacterium]|nr:hypothetical protein [Candidatus Aminicenantes bacterium]
MFSRVLSVGLIAAACSGGFGPSLFASGRLLFFEIQGVAGYSGSAGKIIAYSQAAMESMQKPGIGFDLVQRFSGAGGDRAILAVQGRVVWNAGGEKPLEPQIYNAYLKFKARPFDFWVGHNRPEFGLAAVLDSHALLLQPLAMSGFGFDRDWGIGLERDTSGGAWGVSLTSGSGMTPRFRGNYFLSGRAAFGVLTEDNYSAGVSFGAGHVLDVMGIHLMSADPAGFAMAAADVTWLRNNIENRVELMAGKRAGMGAYAGLWRIGLGLGEESRFKLELQPALVRMNGATRFELSAGMTFLAHPDWTIRAMAAGDTESRSARFIVQVYFYKGIRL